MVKTLAISLPLLLLCWLIGCSTAKEPPSKPADFQVEYHWSAGALPPPYHYEYTIRLGPAEQGEIEFLPDYEYTENLPVWRETFSIEAGEMEKLYALMVERAILSNEWRVTDDIPVGGSGESMIIIADGASFAIPGYLGDESQAKAVGEVYTVIKGLLPEPVWTKLMAQYEQYKQDYSNSQ